MSLNIVELASAVLPGTDEGQKVLAYVKAKYAEEQAPAPAAVPEPEASAQEAPPAAPAAQNEAPASDNANAKTQSAQ